MNDEIHFDGKRYISASDAASSSDFTRDYVARLCRDGKVRGKRVGKNWYVDKEQFAKFLITQEYDRSKRRESLAEERRQEYLMRNHSRVVPVSAPEVMQKMGVLPAVPAAAAPRVTPVPRAAVTGAGAYHVQQKMADAIANHGVKRAGDLLAAPGAADVMLRAVHVPAYTVTPFMDFVHKLVALTTAISLTFGTYALVDPQYARFAADTVREHIHALSDSYVDVTHGGVAKLSARTEVALAAAAEDPSGSFASVMRVVPDATASLARTLNSRVNAIVYSIAFPSFLTQSLAADGGSGSVTISVKPYARGALAGSATSSQSSAPAVSGPVTVVHQDQPVIERIIERQRTVAAAGGITEEELAARLQELDNKLSSKMFSLTAANSSSAYAPAPVITLAQATRIDRLSGVAISGGTISSASISGGTISGTSVSATTLSASGDTSLATTTVTGDLTVNGTLGVQNISLSSTTVTITGTSGQTANFLNIQNASGTTVFAVQPDGTLISNVSSTTQSYSQLLITGNATATNLVVLETASSSNILATNATTTNATSTNLFSTVGHFTTGIIDTLTATIANITGLVATNATTTNATTTNLAVTNLTSFTAPIAPYFTATSSSATSTFAGGVTVSGMSMFNGGLLALASSTIGDGTQAGGLTISGGATTTGDFLISKASAPTTGSIYFGNGTPNFTYNGSDYMFTGGNVYTAANSIIAQADSSVLGLGARYQAAAGTYWVGATNAASPDLVLSNNAGTERARLTDGGYLGIGTTSPWKMLSVAGDIIGTNITATGTLAVSGQASLGSLAGAAVSSLTNGYVPKWNSASGIFANSLVYDNGTQIGIGTTSPYASLSLVGGASGAGTLLAVDAISGFSGKLLDLKVASTTKFSVDQAGSLVLGTALSQTYGGTGITSYTAGDILYADNVGTLAKLAKGADGTVLKLQAGLPAWGVDLNTGSGGSSGNFWATTTLNLIYPVDTAYPVAIGANATSSANSIFEVHGIQYVSSKIGIATTSPVSALSVGGDAYITGGLGVGLSNTTAGTLQTSGDATIGGALTASSLTASSLLYANGSKTVSSVSLDPSLTLSLGALSLNMGNANTWTALQRFANASSTLFSNFGTAYFGGTATSTFDSAGNLSLVSNGLTVGTSQLVVSGGNVGIGTTTPWAKLSIAGGTSGTVVGADALSGFTGNLLDLKVASSSKFTVNQAGDVTSSGLLSFANASTSLLSVFQKAYFGGTATTTIDSAGNIAGAGSITFATGAANYIYGGTSHRFGYSNGTTQNIIYSGGTSGLDIWNQADSQSLVKITDAGNVGVGTTTPWANLAVNPTAGAASNQFVVGSSTATSFIINNSGYVGIGTTTPQWLLNPYSATAPQLALSAGAGIAQWAFRNSGGTLYIATTTTDGTATSSTSALTVTSTGSVGIGTTSPSASLSVNAAAGVNSFAIGSSTATYFLVNSTGNVGIGETTPSGTLGIRKDSSGAEGATLVLTNSTASVANTAVGLYFVPNGASGVVRAASIKSRQTTAGNYADLGFFTANGNTPAEALTISAGGFVGVGTTTPFRKLSVTYTASEAQAAIAYDGTRYTQLQTDASGDFVIDPSGNDAFLNDDNLWVCTGGSCPAGAPSGTGNLVVENKLGIGTSTPQYPLHAYTSSGIVGEFSADGQTRVNVNAYGTDVDPQINFMLDNGSIFSVGVDDSDSDKFKISGSATLGTSDRLIIDGSGNVGIGTSTPSAQLATAGLVFVGGNGATTLGTATSTFYGDIKIAGKLDVGTIDPVYTIDGTKFATYGHSTIGIHEETLQTIVLGTKDASGKYAHIIDFDVQEKGSDLWLFYQITDFGDAWKSLVVSLTPAFDSTVFYKKVPEKHQLIVYSDAPGEVSMRLSGDRFDFSKWGNVRPDQDGDTHGTHIISSKAPLLNIQNATSESNAAASLGI